MNGIDPLINLRRIRLRPSEKPKKQTLEPVISRSNPKQRQKGAPSLNRVPTEAQLATAEHTEETWHSSLNDGWVRNK